MGLQFGSLGFKAFGVGAGVSGLLVFRFAV